MVRQISAFTNLPTPLKVGLLVASGGGVLAALGYILSPRIFWVVLVGLAVVALLLVLYRQLLKWLKKRKAAPMERDLLKSTSATPQGVSEPANVARLDDLRKKFGQGVRTFQAAGKSLYSFPWYMIVGEPGSGKTEAIRHCNVGFPPGLQDEFQGTGGTINMNWWFTDHAVIVDTAGRLMFEEVETGGSREWREFLNLLKKYRPRCPINGVLLVIPSDSLVRDTADQIEQKASKIARQFDVIQRTLDVRFPVFVVVTKSDLINGFRDFFDGLQDPQLQHQILGWSNPAALDEPYKVDFVDQHLKTIQGRLFRRRLALLHEVMTQEPGSEKMRTADALYAFPQSLAKIAPRMGRYLELIFSVGSQWSCKPLFFRGIYFTSSMREGSALDEDLAESLGVAVDSLPDGRVWERDRAYFLRDLFVKKVFREQGLVTQATNASKLHRRRKAAVLISAAVSVILLLGFTFYAANQFNKSIGDIKDYFGGLATLMAQGGPTKAEEHLQTILKMSEDNYRYVGRNGIPGLPDNVRRANISARLADAVSQWQKKGVPWIFAPAARFARRITSDKLNKAQAVIYEVSVLRPFTGAARDLMCAEESGEWTYQNPETKVLRQLVQLKANKALNSEGGYSAGTFLDPFFEYVFGRDGDSEEQEDLKKRIAVYNEDKADLHRPLGIIYAGAWPPASMRTQPNAPEPAIGRGVELFNEYWTDPNRLSARSRDYAQVKAIEDFTGALADFNDAEQRIFTLQDRFAAESGKPYTAEQLDEFVRSWQAGFTSLKKAKDTADSYGRALATGKALEEAWTTAAKTALQEVEKNYGFLLDELKDAKEGDFLGSIRDKLDATGRETLQKLTEGELAKRLRLLDQRFYADVQGRGRLYEIRFEMYSKANSLLGTTSGASGLGEVAQAIKQVEQQVTGARQQVDNLFSLNPTAFHFQKASAVCKLALALAEQRHLYRTVKDGLEAAPKSVEGLEKLVEGTADWDWKGVPTGTINRKYDPNAGGAALAGWKSLGETLKKYELPEDKYLSKVYEDVNGIYTDYAGQCLDGYWLDRVLEDAIKAKVGRDAQRFKDLVVRDVFDELDDLGKTLERALARFGAYLSPSSEKVEQFRANVNEIRDRYKAERIYGTARSVLTKWRGLSADVWETRRALLAIQPGDFREDYTPFSYRFHAEFVNAYWSELTYALLGQLASQVQDQGGRAFRELKTSYGDKFPLGRDSRTDLTPDELIQARSLLNKIRLQERFDSKSVGGGAKAGDDKVDKLLAGLRGIEMPATDSQWFASIEQLFASLPRGQEPSYCRLTLLGKEEQDRLVRADEQLLLPFFTKFRLVQGTDRSKQLRTTSQANVPVDDMIIKYPGPPLLVEFYKLAGDTEPSTNVKFSEPWACLRMFRQCYDERKKGCVKLGVKDETGRGGVFYLLLEFFSDSECRYAVDVPRPDQWPSLKQ